VDYFHYFIQGAEVVAFFYDVLCELGPVICIFEVVVMFPESCSEGSSGLAYVFLIASWALQLWYTPFALYLSNCWFLFMERSLPRLLLVV